VVQTCNVELKHKRLLINLCYCSPSNNAENDSSLLKLMGTAAIRAGTQHVVILGDFNFPQINYNNEHVSAADDDPATLFFNKTQDICLYRHVRKTTRLR